MPQDNEVAVVGLGRMGFGLAVSLRRAGRSVVGFDLDPGVADAAAGAGIEFVAEIDRVAACATILLALPDGPDVRMAVDQIVSRAAEGTLVIDCSTVDPAGTIALAVEAAGHGIRLRDAGMAGGPRDAEQGTLLFMVGCPEDEWDEIRALLDPIGRDVVRCGDTGAGVTLKVVNNLLALTVFLADVEALSIAKSAGLDLDVAMTVLGSTGAANAALNGLVGGQLLQREFAGAFRTALAHKDVRIAVDLAERLGVPLDTLGPTLRTFSTALDQGLGDYAAGAAGLVVERAAGIELAVDTLLPEDTEDSAS